MRRAESKLVIREERVPPQSDNHQRPDADTAHLREPVYRKNEVDDKKDRVTQSEKGNKPECLRINEPCRIGKD